MTTPLTTEDGKTLTAAAVFDSLDRIAESGVLGDKSRLRLLLKFVVDETLEGRGASLKAYTIGTLALGRSDNFDPSSDSIVRVEMNRLRQALDHYYATKGEQDTLRIDIPKGSYKPVFVTISPPDAVTAPPPDLSASATTAAVNHDAPDPPAVQRGHNSSAAATNRLLVGSLAAICLMLLMIVAIQFVTDPHDQATTRAPVVPAIEPVDAPVIEVTPFRNFIQRDDLSYLADGVRLQLISDLSHFSIFRVRQTPERTPGTVPLDRRPADYSLQGTLVDLGQDIRLTLLLIDEADGQVVWSTLRDLDIQSPELSANIIDMVHTISAQLASPSGVLQAEALRQIDAHRRQQTEPVPVSTYECILRWRAYDSYKNNVDRQRVYDCLRQLTDQGSTSGAIWAALAFFEFLDWTRTTDLQDMTGLTKALAAANRAIQLDPTYAPGHEYLASILMARGDLDSALQSYTRAVTLNPSSPDLRVLLGWNRILRGDWKHGVRDVQRGIAISPNPPGWFRIPLALAAFRDGDYRAAFSQADLMMVNGDERGIPLALAAAIRLNNQVAVDQYRELLAASALNPDDPMASIQAVLNVPEVIEQYRDALSTVLSPPF